MTPMDPHPPDDDTTLPRVDEFVGQILDDGTFAAEVAADLSPADRRRVADMQWLDAILEFSLARDQASTERAVESVVRRLRDESRGQTSPPTAAQDEIKISTPVPRTHRRRMRTLITTAVILLIGWMWWQQQTPNVASAMVEQAYQAALRATDRTYRVSIESDRPSAKPLEATLTVRGSDQFVLEYTGPRGQQSWLGRSGSEYWFITHFGPVLIADSNYFARRWENHPEAAGMPFLQITTILIRLRNNYELTQLQDEPLNQGGPAFRHLQAQRRSEISMLPESLELWSNRDSGTVERLILIRTNGLVRRQQQKITLNLALEQQKPDDFYRYRTYAPNRPVLHLTQHVPVSPQTR